MKDFVVETSRLKVGRAYYMLTWMAEEEEEVENMVITTLRYLRPVKNEFVFSLTYAFKGREQPSKQLLFAAKQIKEFKDPVIVGLVDFEDLIKAVEMSRGDLK